ncbi:hypothetical protein BaRGS_00034069, partial [Batillaria attramentaria]
SPPGFRFHLLIAAPPGDRPASVVNDRHATGWSHATSLRCDISPISSSVMTTLGAVRRLLTDLTLDSLGGSFGKLSQ